MTNATHGNQTSQVTVYAAIELSKKSWVISIARPDRDQQNIRRNSREAIFPSLSPGCEQQRRNFGRILVCYEAGYDGFWLARLLTKVGIDVAGSLIPPASKSIGGHVG